MFLLVQFPNMTKLTIIPTNHVVKKTNGNTPKSKYRPTYIKHGRHMNYRCCFKKKKWIIDVYPFYLWFS